MQITVETVPGFEFDDCSAMVMPKVQRKPKVDKSKLGVFDKRTVERYKDAYRIAYGVYPQITKSGKWFKIVGHTSRVTRKRLKEMAQQLEFRVGIIHD